MSVRIICKIAGMRASLVLRGLDEDFAENRKEVGALMAELVLREVPGKSVERRGNGHGLGRSLVVARTGVETASGEVVGVALAPSGLSRGAAGGLTLDPSACALAIADARIRLKPPPTEPAGPLADHRRMLDASGTGRVGRSQANDGVGLPAQSLSSDRAGLGGPFLASRPGPFLASV